MQSLLLILEYFYHSQRNNLFISSYFYFLFIFYVEVKWDLIVSLTCISLAAMNVKHLLKCLSFIYIWSLVKCLFIFNWVILFYYWVVSFYILCIQALYQIYDLKLSFPLYWLSFHFFILSFLAQKLILKKSNLFDSFFTPATCDFSVIFLKSLPIPRFQWFIPVSFQDFYNCSI